MNFREINKQIDLLNDLHEKLSIELKLKLRLLKIKKIKNGNR